VRISLHIHLIFSPPLLSPPLLSSPLLSSPLLSSPLLSSSFINGHFTPSNVHSTNTTVSASLQTPVPTRVRFITLLQLWQPGFKTSPQTIYIHHVTTNTPHPGFLMAVSNGAWYCRDHVRGVLGLAKGTNIYCYDLQGSPIEDLESVSTYQ
jgi:hypothetical protein